MYRADRPSASTTQKPTSQTMMGTSMVLSSERRAEMEVNLALIAAAVTDPGLAAARDESFAGLRYACERVLVLLGDAGELTADLDPALEAARLHALIDGLAAHLTYQAPDAATEWADAVVRRHLESLRPPGSALR
jgi:hypothetical protein